MRSLPFDRLYGFVDAKLRMNLQQKVYMVWHDFHFDYIDLDFFTD